MAHCKYDDKKCVIIDSCEECKNAFRVRVRGRFPPRRAHLTMGLGYGTMFVLKADEQSATKHPIDGVMYGCAVNVNAGVRPGDINRRG